MYMLNECLMKEGKKGRREGGGRRERKRLENVYEWKECEYFIQEGCDERKHSCVFIVN